MVEGVGAGAEDCIMCMVRNRARVMLFSLSVWRALALLMGVHVRDDVRACRGGLLVADCPHFKVPMSGTEYSSLTFPDRPAQQDACGKHGAVQMVGVAMREVAKTRMIMSARGPESGRRQWRLLITTYLQVKLGLCLLWPHMVVRHR